MSLFSQILCLSLSFLKEILLDLMVLRYIFLGAEVVGAEVVGAEVSFMRGRSVF